MTNNPFRDLDDRKKGEIACASMWVLCVAFNVSPRGTFWFWLFGAAWALSVAAVLHFGQTRRG